MASSIRKKNFKQNNWMGYFFIGPWLLAFLAFTLLPMAASLYFAFNDYSSLDSLDKARWIGLQNFERMFFNDNKYWKSVGATLYYVIFAIPLRLTMALGLAMLLNTGRNGVSFYRAAFYAPSIVGGSIAVAVMWRQVFGTEGLFNAAIRLLGLPTRTWLGDPDYAIWTLIALAVWQFGSPMLIFLAGLKQIPTEFYEAASIDGANGVRKFISITLPLLSPVIFFNLIMQMISGLMVFTQAFIITGGAPLDTTLFYALYIYRRAFENFQMGYASAMAWVLLIIIAVFATIVFKTSNQWVYYESKEE
ncbi:MAG: sugar ABC transporter permease [Anaerolineae bacterium]|nr:sugar ABC transporter permease [Anaerolineae bacterium]